MKQIPKHTLIQQIMKSQELPFDHAKEAFVSRKEEISEFDRSVYVK